MATSFIHDGYCEEAYIAAVENLHGELRFTFRPVMVEEGSEFFDSLTRYKGREQERQYAKVMKAHILKWSQVDQLGRPAPLDAKSFLRLKRRLFQKIAGILLGTEPYDTDPLKDPDESDGPQPASEQLAADQKNS